MYCFFSQHYILDAFSVSSWRPNTLQLQGIPQCGPQEGFPNILLLALSWGRGRIVGPTLSDSGVPV